MNVKVYDKDKNIIEISPSSFFEYKQEGDYLLLKFIDKVDGLARIMIVAGTIRFVEVNLGDFIMNFELESHCTFSGIMENLNSTRNSAPMLTCSYYILKLDINGNILIDNRVIEMV